jgi:hypothetical protein
MKALTTVLFAASLSLCSAANAAEMVKTNVQASRVLTTPIQSQSQPNMRAVQSRVSQISQESALAFIENAAMSEMSSQHRKIVHLHVRRLLN